MNITQGPSRTITQLVKTHLYVPAAEVHNHDSILALSYKSSVRVDTAFLDFNSLSD